jgi:hypothetical protein
LFSLVFLKVEITQVQKEFNIEKEGIFYLAAKNPQDSAASLPGIPGLTTPPVHVQLPNEIQSAFGGRSWAPPIPVAMLAYKGLELVLIGESNNVVAQFGKTGEEIEKEEQIDAKNVGLWSDIVPRNHPL